TRERHRRLQTRLKRKILQEQGARTVHLKQIKIRAVSGQKIRRRKTISKNLRKSRRRNRRHKNQKKIRRNHRLKMKKKEARKKKLKKILLTHLMINIR